MKYTVSHHRVAAAGSRSPGREKTSAGVSERDPILSCLIVSWCGSQHPYYSTMLNKYCKRLSQESDQSILKRDVLVARCCRLTLFSVCSH